MAGKKTRPTGNKVVAEGADPRLLRLRELVKILESSTLAELAYQDADIKVSLNRATKPTLVAAPVASAAAIATPTSGSTPATAAAAAAQKAKDEEGMVVVKSPFVGTFYSAPKPGAPPFAQVGERVRRGQTICIIEAMKLMNEIEADCAGKIVEILVENGKSVEYGQKLFKVQKT